LLPNPEALCWSDEANDVPSNGDNQQASEQRCDVRADEEKADDYDRQYVTTKSISLYVCKEEGAGPSLRRGDRAERGEGDGDERLYREKGARPSVKIQTQRRIWRVALRR